MVSVDSGTQVFPLREAMRNGDTLGHDVEPTRNMDSAAVLTQFLWEAAARCCILQYRDSHSQQASRWWQAVEVKAGEKIRMSPADEKWGEYSEVGLLSRLELEKSCCR